MVSESDAHGKGRMIIESLQRFPLFAEINPHVSACQRQIGTALIETEILHLVALV